jgi:hypothetical protein
VILDEFLIIHAVELISGKDQLVVVVASGEAMQVLPHGIGGSLKPIAILHCLLGGEHFDETLAELIEAISERDVPVERRRIVLGEHKHPVQSGIDRIAYRNIDKSILSLPAEPQVLNDRSSAERDACRLLRQG